MRDTTLPPVRVEADFKERLASYAARQDRDVSWVIRKAVEEYLDRHEDSYAARQDRDVSWVIRKAVEEYLDRHEDRE
jgi:predicted transcriptional regulator